MQRLIARFLLIFALVGNGIPLALAAAAPAHACCVRKAHHCRDSARNESEEPTIRAAGCCNHDCWRAVTTSQSANPQPRTTATFAQNVDAQVAESYPETPAAAVFASKSTRAPPQISIA